MEIGRTRLLTLIDILCDLSEIQDYRLLASSGFCQSIYKTGNEEKISGLYNYLAHNYHRDIHLNDMAEHANMNPSAFCRYFRNATDKTFSEAINEIRIGIACKDLIDTDLSISQIAYNCGYRNVPYFNRQFKRIKNSTPLEFRQKYISR
jgi:AraC-like DNA-binding protein